MSLIESQVLAIFTFLGRLDSVATPNERSAITSIREPIRREIRFGFGNTPPELCKSAGYTKGDKMLKITSDEATAYEDDISELPARSLGAAMSVATLGELCAGTLKNECTLDTGALTVGCATGEVLKKLHSRLHTLIDAAVQNKGYLMVVGTSAVLLSTQINRLLKPGHIKSDQIWKRNYSLL